jgi:hypothetical protein
MRSRSITKYLTDDLRRPEYQGNPNRLAGHCYVACEVVFHLNPGKYHSYFIRHEGLPHWFLRDAKTGRIVDPTASQFKTRVSYISGVRKGFLTSEPSKRARVVLERIANERR